MAFASGPAQSTMQIRMSHIPRAAHLARALVPMPLPAWPNTTGEACNKKHWHNNFGTHTPRGHWAGILVYQYSTTSKICLCHGQPVNYSHACWQVCQTHTQCITNHCQEPVGPTTTNRSVLTHFVVAMFDVDADVVCSSCYYQCSYS